MIDEIDQIIVTMIDHDLIVSITSFKTCLMLFLTALYPWSRHSTHDTESVFGESS